MAQDSIFLSQSLRLASDKRSRSIQNVPVDEHYQRVSPLVIGAQPRPLMKYLRQSGGGDQANLAVNGSLATPVNFQLAPTAAQVFRVDRLVLVLVCLSNPNMAEFGDLVALTNGISLELRQSTPDALVQDLLDGIPIKSNNDLAAAAWEVSIAELTVAAAWWPSSPIRLDGGQTHLLRASVRDNLGGITLARLKVEGAIESEVV